MPADFRDRKTANFPLREEKENRNTIIFRGFLPVLWPERRLAGSDSEVFRSALEISKSLPVWHFMNSLRASALSSSPLKISALPNPTNDMYLWALLKISERHRKALDLSSVTHALDVECVFPLLYAAAFDHILVCCHFLLYHGEIIAGNRIKRRIS